MKGLYRSLELVASGRIGYTLISPIEMSGILERVASALPAELRLIAGTQPGDVDRHLAASKVNAVAEGGVIKLVMDLPLQDRSRPF